MHHLPDSQPLTHTYVHRLRPNPNIKARPCLVTVPHGRMALTDAQTRQCETTPENDDACEALQR